MIQDIAPHKYMNSYRQAVPKREGYVLMYKDRQVLCREDEKGSLCFLTIGEVKEKEKGLLSQAVYLFQIDDMEFFMIPGLNDKLYPAYEYKPLKYLRTALPMYMAFGGVTGHQLFTWYENRRFCGHCGKPMVHDQKERMMRCPGCGLMEYPKICPAVIVGITNGDKLLLSKYEGRDYKRYALIAGFAEIGETIEDTVRREVMEEVGLKVKNIRFYKSQPWSFSDTLLMGFYCDLDGDPSIKLDHNELALARWVPREEIPDEGENISLTKEMMMKFKKGEQ